MKSSEAVIDRLRSVLGVSTDAALAEAIGVAPSTLANWRRRNSVPYAECVQVSGKNLVDLNWLLTGEGHEQTQTYIPDYLDREILAIAVDLADRWMERATNITAYARAQAIADYYNDAVKR